MITEIYTKVNGEYLEKNPTWHIQDSPWKANHILHILKRNQIDPNSIVEIGCGAGEILNQLYRKLPENVMFEGYDISSDAYNLARKKTKDRLNFKLGNLLTTDEYYDVLLMIDVFEHVEDYFDFIRASKFKAKYKIYHIPLDISVNSVLRNKFENLRYSVGHIQYFSKETAIATLQDCGLNIVDYFYTAGAVELEKKSELAKWAVWPRKLLYKINKDLAVKLFGGYSLMVLAI
jgi:SAM-dependent methyltransferase